MSFHKIPIRQSLHWLDRCRSGDGIEFHYLREFERSQYLAPDELRRLAFARLRKLVDHAYMYCPFYRRQLDRAGVPPTRICCWDDFEMVPVLEKRDIQKHRDEMVAENWPQAQMVPNLTGGSTGTPLSFFVSRDRMRSRTAATWRHNRWAGFDIGDKNAAIWGAARDAPLPTWKSRLRNVLLDRRIHLNTATITPDRLREFDRELKRFRPKTIVAYAKSVVLFARFLKQERIAAYQPKSIITSAEVLENQERDLLEEVFGCRVFNRYGCREVSVIASECEQHCGMHTMAEGLHVEILQDGRPTPSGELGEVVVTDLLNYAMPLIRYRIGDMAALMEGACRCGRGLPRLERVAGRVTDFLVGTDGRLVSGAVLTVAVIARRPRLGQVQIWQDRVGQILFKIAPPEGQRPPAADLEFLASETREYLGHDTHVDFEFVDEIACEASGKFLFSRSNLPLDRMLL